MRAAALVLLGLGVASCVARARDDGEYAPDGGAFSVGSTESHGRKMLSNDVSWVTGEGVRTSNGAVPLVSCPVGMYRTEVTGDNLNRATGQRVDGCRFCPRGRYGSVAGLVSSSCSAACPRGEV
mmetsp:Transcript_6606/g.18808  ORF Transcript_6606/g.18808 Transcript_6606/m.18808 type:complete len:124 (-) Transcript_6606:599-970(-)